MIYYVLLLVAAALFATQFLFQKKFESSYGTDIKSTLVFSVGTGFGMGVVSLIFTGGKFDITLFSCIVALLHGTASFLYMYFSLKALNVANISVFSVFTMLGGMLLPTFYGVCFAGETLTLGKSICCALVTVSVLCTANGGKADKKAWLYYIAVFLANGMTSVCAAIHQNYPALNVDSYSYMVLSSFALMIWGLIFLPFVKIKRKIPPMSYISMAGFSVCSGIGNIILMIALLVLPASLQFPFATGAAVVFSAVITKLQKIKMTKGEVVSVIIAFVATVFMMY